MLICCVFLIFLTSSYRLAATEETLLTNKLYQNAQACEVDDPSNCATASVAITIDIYNVKGPEFNHPYGHAQIDLGSCPGDIDGQCNIPVVLDKSIKANDGDGEICFVKTSP